MRNKVLSSDEADGKLACREASAFDKLIDMSNLAIDRLRTRSAVVGVRSTEQPTFEKYKDIKVYYKR